MKIRFLLNSIIFISITVLISVFLRYDIYEHDDFSQSFFYTTDLWSIFANADHGRYFSWIYMKLVVHGSMWLQGIHPNMDMVPKIIMGVNIALLALLMSRFVTAPFYKKLSPFWFIITFCVLLLIFIINPPSFMRYNQHFAYQSNLIWFFLIWCVFVSYFIDGRIPEKKDFTRNCVLAFILGVTAHFNLISSIGIMGVLFLYGIYYFGKQKNWDIKEIWTSYMQILCSRYIYVPLLCFVIGCVLYFSAPGFQHYLNQRTTAGEEGRIVRALLLIPEFIPALLKYVFWKYNAGIIMFSMIFFSTLLMFLSDPQKKNERVIIMAWALVAGAAFFNASLILTGKSHYLGFWVASSDLIVVTRMMLFTGLLLLIGRVLVVSNKVIRIVIMVGTVFCTALLFHQQRVISWYRWFYSSFKEDRITWYMTEKIYRLYSLNKKTAVLPAYKINEDGSFHHRQFYRSTKEKPMELYGIDYINRHYPLLYYKDIANVKEIICPALFVEYPQKFRENYVEYFLTNKEIALEMYSNMGGVFSEEELKNPNFNLLFDTNFILNKKSEEN